MSVAVAGSVFVHVLLLLPFILGASTKTVRVPFTQGAGASATVSSADPVMTMILIDAPQINLDPEQLPEDIASRGFAADSLAVKIVSPDPTPFLDVKYPTTDQDAPEAVPEAAGDMSGHARLFGRYMGQIMARIERAWVRPRSPITDPLFQCRVKIKQGKQGEVREVEMQQCNGDSRWQTSLSEAIFTASPLPAPPDPSVFADALTLSFDSEPFRAGGSGEGFEPERIEVASIGSFSLGPATSEILKQTSLPGVIELRITGIHDDSIATPPPRASGSDNSTEPSDPSDVGAAVPPAPESN